MQESGQKIEATGSTRFQNTLWNKIDLDRTSYYIDGPIHSAFVESTILFELYDSEAQIQTRFYYITEVCCLNTLAGSLR